MEGIIVYIFGILGLYSGVGVITGKTGVQSAINLILVFVNMCGVLICLGIDMLGLLLIVIYVGAVAILFLFVIMMVGEEEVKKGGTLGKGVLVVLSIVLLNREVRESNKGLNMIMEGEYGKVLELWDRLDTVKVLGENLFTSNIYNVIAVGVLLLVGMIGGVVLGKEK